MSGLTTSWMLIGGMGEEKLLWEIMGKPSLYVVGTEYVLTSESFVSAPWAEMAFAEYLTHNYAGMVAEAKGIIHLSNSLFSCYLAMDLALMHKKPAWIFVPGVSWRLFFLSDAGNSCLHCVEPYTPPDPAFCWEKLSLKWVEIFSHLWGQPPSQSTLWYGDGEKKSIEPNPMCPFHRGEHPYAMGKHQLIVAVSCGENSVAITPSFERHIDLSTYERKVKSFVRIRKTNAFFMEMEYQGFNCLVFRQGRFIVKGTKEKNTALYLYRQLIGV